MTSMNEPITPREIELWRQQYTCGTCVICRLLAEYLRLHRIP